MVTKVRKSTTATHSRKRAPSPATAPVGKNRRLEIAHVPGKSDDRIFADVISDGIVSNSLTAMRFVGADQGVISLTDMVASLEDRGRAVNRGDLSTAEQMLNSQAVALNAIFGELARRAELNMGEYPEAFERYMRLALKAQSQSRATVETLAAIKNPPVVFARQANINNGGQQQVNNGVGATVPAHAAKSEVVPTELSKGIEYVEWMDTGATRQAVGADVSADTGAACTPGSADRKLETVGAIDRPAHRERQSTQLAEPIPGRSSRGSARAAAPAQRSTGSSPQATRSAADKVTLVPRGRTATTTTKGKT